MAISSSVLFHFTNSFDNLKGILRDNFKVKYCNETYKLKNTTVDIHVPMVSFCDIPLSKADKHSKSYGSYAIGLTKEWAINKGLNPVIYVERNSNFALNHLKTRKLLSNKIGQKLSNDEKAYFDIYRYIKNYDGDLKRSDGKISKKYKFYDEREWRYVPDIENSFLMLMLNSKIPKDSNDYLENQKKVSEQLLEFTPNDIKYIILNDENEIDETVKLLQTVKAKYSYKDVQILTTRIICMQQILEDF